MMNKAVMCLLLLSIASCLPYVEQMCLANSMIVGKEDQSDLINWQCNVCDATNRPLHTHYIEENEKDVKCVLSVYPTFVVLAFRYTNTLLNVWQDILYANQIVDVNVCTNCKVQKAYKKMWQSITSDVLRDLKEIQKQTGLNRIYITGISLGGGLAVISYIDVKNSNIFATVNVITYGAPRVANKQYAENFNILTNNKAVRFDYKGDPIVVMPQCLTFICNYKHVGTRRVCDQTTETCTKTDQEPQGFFEQLQWVTEKHSKEENLGSIVDHIYGYKKIYNWTLIQK